MRSARTHADLDWLRAGDHVCHFYDTAEDLADVMIPHFKVGLERREACIWIAGNPYGPERARSEMRTAVADFDNRMAAGQMQIVSQDEWSEKCGALGTAEKIRNWLSWKDEALASGYTGVRTGGDLSSLYESSLDDFLDYERAVDRAFRRQPIVALCSYCLARYSGQTVLDAMQGHGFGLARRRGQWKPIEAWDRNQSTTRVAHAPSAPRPTHEADLGQIIEELLAVYMVAYPGRLALEGGPVTLPALSASRLRMALIELAINAVQFGAFAIPQGALAVNWYVAVNGSRRLHMAWTERGLSGLAIPNRIGRGTRALAGTVENCVRTFEPTGVRYTFELGL
jgi:DcmR-like sensory protein